MKRVPDRHSFSTDQIVAATGISPDDVRRLITWGAIVPLPGSRGRGRTRTWDMDSLHHVARVAAIKTAGMSLRLSHTIACLQPFWFIFGIYDPHVLAFNAGDKEGWFDPGRQSPSSDEHDQYIYLCNGRYLWLGIQDSLFSYGQLNHERTEVLCKIDFEEWFEGHNVIDASLAWRYMPEMADDEFDQVWAAPVSKVSINLTLAMRLAARRILNLPIRYPDPATGDAAA